MERIISRESKTPNSNGSLFDSGGLMDLTDKEFKELSRFIYNRFGINLTEKKRALLKGRLNKVVRSLGFSSYRDYYEFIKKDETNSSLLVLIDKISTNHTYFFRGKDHYDYMVDTVLPEIDSGPRGKDKLRIWSAGCSSGQEAYTIAMVLKVYYGGLSTRDIGILGTDISMTALEQARKGLYPLENLNEMPSYYKDKSFENAGNSQVKIDKSLQEMVLFKRLNLMNKAYPFQGKFHIIYCRNVMIYFDNKTRVELVNRFYDYIHPGGYLFVGHSESLCRKSSPFRYIKPAIYRKD